MSYPGFGFSPPQTINYHGQNNQLIVLPGYEVSIDRLGIMTGTVRFKCPIGSELQLMPQIYSAHPDFNIMLCTRVRFKREEGWAWLDADYEGAILPGQDEYELSFSVGEEPIETHPNFKSTLAGTPGPDKSEWLNGAIFTNIDNTSFWKFDSFGNADPGATNSLYGVTAYLDATQVTWRHSYLASSPPADISTVGTIQTPDGPAPSLGGSRNWLLLSVEYTRRGYIYHITKQWRGSGWRGWNPLIYAAP